MPSSSATLIVWASATRAAEVTRVPSPSMATAAPVRRPEAVTTATVARPLVPSSPPATRDTASWVEVVSAAARVTSVRSPVPARDPRPTVTASKPVTSSAVVAAPATTVMVTRLRPRRSPAGVASPGMGGSSDGWRQIRSSGGRGGR